MLARTAVLLKHWREDETSSLKSRIQERLVCLNNYIYSENQREYAESHLADPRPLIIESAFQSSYAIVIRRMIRELG